MFPPETPRPCSSSITKVGARKLGRGKEKQKYIYLNNSRTFAVNFVFTAPNQDGDENRALIN